MWDKKYWKMQDQIALPENAGPENTRPDKLRLPSDSDTEDMARSTATSTVTMAADMCHVCLLVPRAAVALVLCGHRHFCAPCTDTVETMDSCCPVCRTPIRKLY